MNPICAREIHSLEFSFLSEYEDGDGDYEFA
jgi:hypothetical protein